MDESYPCFQTYTLKFSQCPVSEYEVTASYLSMVLKLKKGRRFLELSIVRDFMPKNSQQLYPLLSCWGLYNTRRAAVAAIMFKRFLQNVMRADHGRAGRDL